MGGIEKRATPAKRRRRINQPQKEMVPISFSCYQTVCLITHEVDRSIKGTIGTSAHAVRNRRQGGRIHIQFFYTTGIMLWFLEMFFYRAVMVPKIRSFEFKTVPLPRVVLDRLSTTLRNLSTSDQNMLLGSGTSFSDHDIERTISFWTRHEPTPLNGSFAHLARKQFSNLALKYVLVFPCLSWFGIMKIAECLFNIGIRRLGFRRSVYDGVEIWDNNGESDHTILYFHGISPDSLLAHLPWFAKLVRQTVNGQGVRVIIPVNSSLAFRELFPQKAVGLGVMFAVEKHLRASGLGSVHAVGHSAGVAMLNCWYSGHKVLSRACVDPVHHLWITRSAQQSLLKTLERLFGEFFSRFYSMSFWVETALVLLLRCPSMASVAIEMTNDIAFYNVVDTDDAALVYYFGKKDTLSNDTIEHFQRRCRRTKIVVSDTLHGETLYRMDLDALITFQRQIRDHHPLPKTQPPASMACGRRPWSESEEAE